MAISDSLKKKMMQAQGTSPGGMDESESPSGSVDGESASDIDAEVMKGAKPNPLKMWAEKKVAG